MPDDEEYEVSWLALSHGTPVFAKDGKEIGKVSHILADVQKDIFDGIGFKEHLLGAEEMLPASAVDVITNRKVTLTLTSDEVKEKSQTFKAEQEFKVDPGRKKPRWERDRDD